MHLEQAQSSVIAHLLYLKCHKASQPLSDQHVAHGHHCRPLLHRYFLQGIYLPNEELRALLSTCAA